MRPILTPVSNESPPAVLPRGLQLSTGLAPGIGERRGRSGLHPSISYGDYHQDPALRHSLLNRMSVSPLYLKASLEEGDESSTDMTLGRVFHTITLQPELEDATIVVVDASTRSTNKYKDAVLANPGKDIVMKDEFENLCRMRDNFMAKAINRQQLHGALLEASVFWSDVATGVACKARPDIIGDGVLCDVKTTRDMNYFASDAKKFGYYRQAAWYIAGAESVTGLKFHTFRFIVAEKTGARDSKVFEIAAAELAIARSQNAANLIRYRQCAVANQWPGYAETIEVMA